MTVQPARKLRAQAVLTVQRVEQVSPGMVRITAGGDGFDQFDDNEFTDRYVKLLIADPRHELQPPYDLEALRATAPEKLPSRRTYTVRESNADERWLSIDFVLHGEEGVAGPWARNATPGDTLVLSGAGGKYRPEPEAAWHLIVGDHSSLPAISAAIEQMPRDARGHALISISDPADRVLPEPPAGLQVRWFDTDEELLSALAALEWEADDPQVFAHGERGTIKQVRGLLKQHAVPRENLSISAYWARGRAEDQFQAEKREPIGQIED